MTGDKNNFMEPTQGEDSTKREVKGGLWVKASDRLPKNGDLYHTNIRMTDTDLDGFPSATNFYNEWEVQDDYEVVEWLDESILPSQPDAEKEACEFAEWMAKDGYYPQKDEPLGTVWCKGFGKNMIISQTKYVYNQYLKTKQ